ncbi:MAG: DMT family transporter [Coriobacteriia bacterium]
MRRNTAVLLVVVSAACFATLAVLTQFAYDEGATPLPLLAWRFAITAALLGAYAGLTSGKALVGAVAETPRFAAMSLTGYGAASICFFFALQHTAASVVAVLLYAYPAMVAFADALIRKEPVGSARLAAIVLTFAGCALVAGVFQPGVTVSPLGIVLGLAAAVGYSVFTLLSERVSHTPRLVVMTYTFALSAAGVAVVTVLAGESLSPVDWSLMLWVLLGLIVVLPTVVAVLLFLRGVRELGASRAALVSTLEPVFTIALAALLLGERLTPVQYVGAALVVAGIALAEWPGRTPAPPL